MSRSAAGSRFDIYARCGYPTAPIGSRDTIEEAERFARWHVARRSRSLEIVDTAKPKDEVVAFVSQDVLGRVWTDVMAHQEPLL
jgi:hypothetical protein